MQIFKLTSMASLFTLFPVCKKTGEVKYDYEALQVMRIHGDSSLILEVDGVIHDLNSNCFVYGLVLHPDSNIKILFSDFSGSGYTLFCQPVDHPCPVLSQERLVIDQPKDEADAYDAFLQAQKLVHQKLYTMDIDPEDDDDLDGESILSDYDDDEIPTPYEFAHDPTADEIEDRIRRVPVDPPEPPAKGSDVPPTQSAEGNPPQEA